MEKLGLHNHYSVRKYSRRIVEESIIKDILEASIRASNTGNMQLYSIVLSTQPKIKEELLPLHFSQKMVVDAPLVFTFCADINRFSKWCELRGTKPCYDNFLWFSTAPTDTVLAAENAAVAAEAHGLGICFLGTTMYNAEEIAEALNLPKGVVPVVTMVAGYPESIPAVPTLTERLPLDAVVHFEKYHDYTDSKINEYFSEIENLDKMKAFVAENNLQNLAEVFTQVRYTEKDGAVFSKKYLDFVKKSFRME